MKKTILLTGSSGFLGKIFLRESLKRKYQVIDILRSKNKKNLELNKLRKYYQKSYKSVFFKNNNDLLKKIKYYLMNDKERQKIARSGRNRMKLNDLTWKSNMRKIFLEINKNTN